MDTFKRWSEGKKNALFFWYSKTTIKNLSKKNNVFVVCSEKESVFASFRGSMSLEASLVIPILLMFLMSILLSVEMVRLQSNVIEALHQGASVAFEKGNTCDAIEVARSFVEGKSRPYVVLKNQGVGLQLKDESSVEIDGYIRLEATYEMLPFVRWIPLGNLKTEDQIVAYSFVGYLGNSHIRQKETEDEYVFVTETGTKYHVMSECSYIKLHPTALDYSLLKKERNNSGGRYYPCERCRPSRSGIIYITKDGESFHSDMGCSSLKRTVSMIPLREARQSGYTACSKCG